LDNVDVGGVTLKLGQVQYNLQFLLGLLNSKLMKWLFPFVSAPFRGGYFSANRQFLSQLPVCSFNKDMQLQVEVLVTQMLDLNKRLATARLPQEKTILQRQIAATDHQIDQLVYQLYSLTNEEIAIIEGAV
jgi:hypothetical protein